MSSKANTSRKILLQLTFFCMGILGIFVAYGLSGHPIEIAENIKQVEVKEWFYADKSEPVDVVMEQVAQDNTQVLDSSATATLKTSLQPGTASPYLPSKGASKYILLTGDSMTEQLRFRLGELAKFNGHHLTTCIWYSSTTKSWSKSERLTELCKEYKPDVIIFTLGSNELFLPGIKSREKYIQGILAEAKKMQVPIIWLGPPNWRDDTGLNALLKKNLGDAGFYNSDQLREKLVNKRASDGRHPNRSGATLWANEMSEWLRTESLLKDEMRFALPEDTSYSALSYQPEQPTPCRRTHRYHLRILDKDDVPVYCDSSSVVAAIAKANNKTPEEDKKPPVTPKPAIAVEEPKPIVPAVIEKVDTTISPRAVVIDSSSLQKDSSSSALISSDSTSIQK